MMGAEDLRWNEKAKDFTNKMSVRMLWRKKRVGKIKLPRKDRVLKVCW